MWYDGRDKQQGAPGNREHQEDKGGFQVHRQISSVIPRGLRTRTSYADLHGKKEKE
jgi:hypothetical protein